MLTIRWIIPAFGFILLISCASGPAAPESGSPATAAAAPPGPQIEGLSFSSDQEGLARLTWSLREPQKVASVRLSFVVKRIGQGRKPFSPLATLDPQTASYEYRLAPLSDVFFQVTAILKDGREEKGVEIRGLVKKNNVVVDELDGRRLFIYLPPGYDGTASDPYPVAYMQDGQNLFSSGSGAPAEWQVDETLDRLVAEKKIPPMVAVGIASYTSRTEDFWPRELGHAQGKGEEYAAWIVERLLPYVEKKYRVSGRREDRAVLGSSFGAAISLYLGIRYGAAFGFVAPMSPAMDFGGLDYLGSAQAQGTRFYLDCGEKEYYAILHKAPFDFPSYTRRMATKFEDRGYVLGKDLFYLEVPGAATHKEEEAALRIHIPFLLFKGQGGATLADVVPSLSYSHKDDEFGPAETWINAIARFTDQSRLTLLDRAQYRVAAGQARIDRMGRIEFLDGEAVTVEVEYDGLKRTLIVKRP